MNRFLCQFFKIEDLSPESLGFRLRHMFSQISPIIFHFSWLPSPSEKCLCYSWLGKFILVLSWCVTLYHHHFMGAEYPEYLDSITPCCQGILTSPFVNFKLDSLLFIIYKVSYICIDIYSLCITYYICFYILYSLFVYLTAP